MAALYVLDALMAQPVMGNRIDLERYSPPRQVKSLWVYGSSPLYYALPLFKDTGGYTYSKWIIILKLNFMPEKYKPSPEEIINTEKKM
ncbi:MAG TPA: hypothetical protein VJ028_00125, partial [Patescibacteria group bacterium]|nr:hypothetical protein [Patescibacteria group bacterium]